MLAYLLFIGALGCGKEPNAPPPPQTYPVSGKVVQRGGKPFPGGVIHFTSTAEPSLATTGTIAADGTFEVFTTFRGERLPGAVRGPFTVMVTPPLTENKPVDIHQPKKVFEVKEGENQFTIELDR